MVPEDNILALIPQRPPFVMIDKLLDCSEDISRTSFQIPEKNVLSASGVFSEAGLIENMAQTVAAGAGFMARSENKPVTSGYIGAVKNMEIINLPKINEVLITEIKIEDRVLGALLISGRIFCNEKLIASCEMKIFLENTT